MYKVDSVVVTANVLSTTSMSFSVQGFFGVTQGTCTCGTASGREITVPNWSSMTLSGTTGEVSKNLTFGETKMNNTATTTGNYIIYGTLIFTYGGNSYQKNFSFDTVNQWPEYTKEEVLY
jgi:hypothetical protein